MRPLLARAHVVVTDAFGFELHLLPHGPQVRVVDGRTDAAVALQRVEGGCALHLIRYDYDDDADRVPPLETLALDVRLPFAPSDARAFSPGGDLTVAAEPAADGVRLTLRRVPLYGIVSLRRPS